jgi:hypothetical protein
MREHTLDLGIPVSCVPDARLDDDDGNDALSRECLTVRALMQTIYIQRTLYVHQ